MKDEKNEIEFKNVTYLSKVKGQESVNPIRILCEFVLFW